MQITTLNRIINLFIVGILANILVVVAIYYLANDGPGNAALKWLKDIDASKVPLIAVTMTFVFFSTSILTGVIIDAISYLIFHEFVKRFLDKPWIVWILCLGDRKRLRDAFWDKFQQQFRQANKYKDISRDNEYAVDKSLAAAIFFHTANKETVDWVMQHYSFYVLSLDFVVVVLIEACIILFLPFSCCTKIWITGVNTILIYLLLHQTFNKYLYTYEATFRHCTVVLSEERRKNPRKIRPA